MIYAAALLCVLFMAIGQILFKLGANQLKTTGSFLEPRTFLILCLALSIYALTTLVWIWILQKIDLGKIYPLMAMAFVIVPIGSYFILGERFQPHYFLGVFLIVTGIVIVIKP